MNAVRLPVLEPAVTCPTYDNTYLGWEPDWIITNRDALLGWWMTLGGDAPTEFGSFARSQHDIELARREDFRNTLRMHE